MIEHAKLMLLSEFSRTGQSNMSKPIFYMRVEDESDLERKVPVKAD
jgi:hypothetical protein